MFIFYRRLCVTILLMSAIWSQGISYFGGGQLMEIRKRQVND
nr:MAG TPA: hypothetical protein [Caudoviricetes sp.]